MENRITELEGKLAIVKHAIETITGRQGAARVRLREIEEAVTQNLIRFGMGEITAEELDAHHDEATRLRATLDEDCKPAVQHLERKTMEIFEQIRMERAAIEAAEQRRQFAQRYNELLDSHEGFSQQKYEALAPAGSYLLDGPTWHRFSMARINYGNLPRAEQEKQTFGQFAGLSHYLPEG